MFESDLARILVREATTQGLKTKKEVKKLIAEMDKKNILTKQYVDLIIRVVTDANRFL